MGSAQWVSLAEGFVQNRSQKIPFFLTHFPEFVCAANINVLSGFLMCHFS